MVKRDDGSRGGREGKRGEKEQRKWRLPKANLKDSISPWLRPLEWGSSCCGLVVFKLR